MCSLCLFDLYDVRTLYLFDLYLVHLLGYTEEAKGETT